MFGTSTWSEDVYTRNGTSLSRLSVSHLEQDVSSVPPSSRPYLIGTNGAHSPSSASLNLGDGSDHVQTAQTDHKKRETLLAR
jgi:hypothetical protein